MNNASGAFEATQDHSDSAHLPMAGPMAAQAANGDLPLALASLNGSISVRVAGAAFRLPAPDCDAGTIASRPYLRLSLGPGRLRVAATPSADSAACDVGPSVLMPRPGDPSQSPDFCDAEVLERRRRRAGLMVFRRALAP